MIKQQEKVNKVAGDAMKKLIAFCNAEGMLNPKINMQGTTEDGDHYQLVFEKIRTRKNYDLFQKAEQVCRQEGYCSAVLLQRKLDIDYTRAGKIIDDLEDAKIISKFEGAKNRRVLVNG